MNGKSASLKTEYVQGRLFWRLLVLMIGLILTYIYLVNNTIFNIVSRQYSLDQAGEIASEVATLESRYLHLSGGITLQLARDRGFRDASALTVYTPVTPTPVALTRRPN